MTFKRFGCILTLIFSVFYYSQTPVNYYFNDIQDALDHFQDPFQIAPTARSSGMSGSMGALGADFGATKINPAGLGMFQNSEINLSMRLLSNSNRTSVLESKTATKTKFNFAGASYALDLGNVDPDLGFNLGIDLNSVNLTRRIAFPKNTSLSFSYENEPEQYYLSRAQNYTDGTRTRVDLMIAARVENKFYAGFSVGYHTMHLSKYSNSIFLDPNAGKSLGMVEQYTPYFLDSDGLSINLGLLTKLTPEFRLGLSYHSPVWWSIANNYESYGMAQDSAGAYYVTESNNFYNQNDLRSPSRATLSGAYIFKFDAQALQALAINLDASAIFYKHTQFSGEEFYESNNRFFSENAKTVTDLRLGVEYKFKKLKFRAGGLYMSSPIENHSISGEYNLTKDNTFLAKDFLASSSNGYSLGTGYDWDFGYIDLAYSRLQKRYFQPLYGDYFSDAMIADTQLSLDSSGSPFLGKVNSAVDQFILTLGFRF